MRRVHVGPMCKEQHIRRDGVSDVTQGLDAIVGLACIRLVEWHDRAVDVRGVDSRSPYSERFWLPILGPSTLWLLRYFAWRLDHAPGGVDLSLRDVARSVGLGERIGRQAPFFRTIGRAIDFAMIRVDGCGTIACRRRLPLLSSRQLARLPDSLRLCHEHWTRNVADSEPSDTTGVRSFVVGTARR